MKIELNVNQRKTIIDALKLARRDALNELDWSTNESSEESDRFQQEIDKEYDGLIDLMSKGLK